MPVDDRSHCYRVRLPSAAEACRIRGLTPPPARTVKGIHCEAGWLPELDARRFAAKVGGYVETWAEFVKLWRTLYPLAKGGKGR